MVSMCMDPLSLKWLLGLCAILLPYVHLRGVSASNKEPTKSQQLAHPKAASSSIGICVQKYLRIYTHIYIYICLYIYTHVYVLMFCVYVLQIHEVVTTSSRPMEIPSVGYHMDTRGLWERNHWAQNGNGQSNAGDGGGSVLGAPKEHINTMVLRVSYGIL